MSLASGHPARPARRRWLAASLAAVPLTAWPGSDYPARSPRLVVPFPPAGATDILARLLADALGRQLGRAIVVDNRPGAGGNVGGELVARAAPDGYTLLMAPLSVYAAGKSLMPGRAFDLERDFAPVATIAAVPHVLVVPAQLGVTSLQAFLGLARAKPGTLTIASQGVGTISHLEAELLQSLTGTRFTHVPYKGSAPAHLDLLAGRVQAMFDSVAASLQHVRSGKLSALAVTTPARCGALPAVPTVAEAGVVGYVSESWLGVIVPAKVPTSVILRLQAAVEAVVKDPAFVARALEHGLEASYRARADVTTLIQAETALWARVVRGAGLKLE